jgi:hypothetical protein
LRAARLPATVALLLGGARTAPPAPEATLPPERPAPGGGGLRAVLTAQKRQPRVQVSPSSIMVAVAVVWSRVWAGRCMDKGAGQAAAPQGMHPFPLGSNCTL